MSMNPQPAAAAANDRQSIVETTPMNASSSSKSNSNRTLLREWWSPAPASLPRRGAWVAGLFLLIGAVGGAAAPTQAPVGPSGPSIIDWSQNSIWVNRLRNEGADLVAKPTTNAPPSKGRELTKPGRLDLSRGNVRSLSQAAGRTGRSISAPASGAALAAGVTLGFGEQVTPAIEELVYGLGNDPLAIFNWVRTKVDYLPYDGMRQGAHVTMLEQQGNDFDQCVLLVSLLKQAGVPSANINYVELDVDYTAAQISPWLGWDIDVVDSNLNVLGIPHSKVDASTVKMRRVVVDVSLYDETAKTNVKHRLDPAYKRHTSTTAVGLAQVNPLYSASSLTSQAGAVALNDDQVKISNANVNAFQAALGTVATAYVGNAATAYHGRDASSLLGLPVLAELERAQLPDAGGDLGTVWSERTVWSEIPYDLCGKVRLYMGTWEQVYLWSDLADDVINIRFAADGRASLYRDQDFEGTEGGAMGGPFVLGSEIVPPRQISLGRVSANTPVERSGFTVVMHSFASSRGRMKAQAVAQAEAAHSDPNSALTQIYTLALVGLQRAVHSENATGVVGALNDLLVIHEPSIWYYHQRGNNYNVDGPMVYTSNLYRKAKSDIYQQKLAAFQAWGIWTSATEHLCLEQLSTPAAKSTAAVFESALRADRRLLRLRRDNWASLSAQITGGPLPGVQTKVVDFDNRAFVPDINAVSIFNGNGMNGGAAEYSQPLTPGFNSWLVSYAYTIDGALNGGTRTNVTNGPAEAQKNTDTKPDAPQQTTGADPVDLHTGAFLYEAPGLTLGSGSGPSTLDYRHFYSSAQNFQDTAKIGAGWTHSYDLSVTQRHATDVDLRTASVAEIAPLVVAMQYLLDIITLEPTAKEIALRALAVNWAARNFVKSKATVALGQNRLEFHRLADGSYLQASHQPATLVRNADGSYRLAIRHGDTINFNSADGRANSVVDPYGNTLSLSYVAGNLSTVTDAYFRTLTFTYGASGITSVTDSTGRSVTYTRNGNLKIIDPDGFGMTFVPEDNRIHEVIDGRNRYVIRNHYDPFHRVWGQEPLGDGTRFTEIRYAPGWATEVDATGARSRTVFDWRGRRVAFYDAVGNAPSKWSYDGADRLTKAITPLGATTSMTYDAEHVLRSVTNPAGHTRTIDVLQARPSVVRDFEGKEATIAYDDPVVGGVTAHTLNVTSVTAPGGIVTTSTYDTRGRLWHHHPASFAAGQDMVYSYDAFGHIDKVTYPDNADYPGKNFDDYTFSPSGNLQEFKDRREVRVTHDYNNRRLRTSSTLWNGTTGYQSTTYYDEAGDVDYTLDAAQRKVDFDYDALGHLLTMKHGPAAAPVTTLTRVYDARNLLGGSIDALDQMTTYTYDGAQRLTDTFDPLLRHHQVAYDADGHPTTTTTPLASKQTTAYQIDGLAKGASDGEEQVVGFSYDKDGRTTWLSNRLAQPYTTEFDDAQRTVKHRTPRQQSGKPASTRATTTTLSLRGLPAAVTKPSGQQTTFDTYDAEGRLKAKSDGVGATAYTYWENGLLKSVTENGRTTYREYDFANRLVRYDDGEGHTLLYDYHPSGELKEITYPAVGGNPARKVSYAYDDFGRLWTVTDWANRVTRYGYDNAGRLTRIDRPTAAANSDSAGTYRVQEYDAASQLRIIKEYTRAGSLILLSELAYDDDGRIVSSFVHPKPAAFTLRADALTYDDPNVASDNRLATWNGQTVQHDEDGNMTSGPLSTTIPGGGIAVGTYGYDVRNRLTSAGGAGYRYNPDGLRVEITGNGAATFVVDPNAALSRTLIRTKAGTTTYYVYGLGLLYEDTGGATKAYHANQVGSTLAITDGNQTVTDRVGYAPFGAITERTNPGGSATDTPFLFNGELGVMTDGNGLVYMRARYYNPQLMRFCNADPIGFAGGLNWYAAFGNNPVSFTDPSGFERQGSQSVTMLDRFVVTATRTAADFAATAKGQAAWLYDGFIGRPMGVLSQAHTDLGNLTSDPLLRRAVEIAPTLAMMFGGEAIAAMRAARLESLAAESGALAKGGTTLAEEMGILRQASKGTGNYGLGTAGRADAMRLGESWVGEGATVRSDGIMISADKLRQFRPPSAKASPFATTGTQANFELRSQPFGPWAGNGHLNITAP